MPSPSALPRRSDYRQHLEIETPEHVVLDFEIAGIGSRALAAVIDLAIILAALISIRLLLRLLAGFGLVGGWGAAIYIGATFLIMFGYFTFFEGLREGQTPGKRRMGLRVVRDTGHPVTFGTAAIRNIVRLADMFFPPPYFLGGLLVALHPRAKRLGDMVAGTVVVRDRPFDAPAPTDRPAAPGDALAVPALADDEFRVLAAFQARAAALDPVVRDRLAAGLVVRFTDRRPARGEADVAFLDALHADELSRRQGRIATRATTGGSANRLAARQQGRWREFEALAARVAQGGLGALGAEELPDFAARYREIAADLARLRTYGAEPALVHHVERLVAAGHNALYRDDRHTVRSLWTAALQDWPAAVVGARRYVLAGFLAFIVPAAVGYAVIRDQPALAEALLPDVMLRRADAGLARTGTGERYVEVDAAARPMMASAIATNNVRVAFMCFAGGVILGVGALFFLAFNGLQIGMISGHFANVGLLGYLMEFILGHGALELFAIWVAGAAGFLLGRSIIAPGELTRADALVVNGRIAVRMLGAATVCLLVAGGIEGFVSASDIGLGGRAAASGLSLLFLAAYLAAGARYRARG